MIDEHFPVKSGRIMQRRLKPCCDDNCYASDAGVRLRALLLLFGFYLFVYLFACLLVCLCQRQV